MSDASWSSDDAVLRFVEQFALLLTGTGLPRMAARVFAFMLADDADTYTASELAAGLRVSTAAVSGAVRQLAQQGLVLRDRQPGSSADSYRVHDDAWSSLARRTEEEMKRGEALLAGGADLLGESGAVREALEFCRFWRAELPRAMARWREHRRVFLAEEEPASRA